jgi:chaperonin GroEL
MKKSNIDVIGKTFQEISDIVTPTMGAKGRMAVINDEFSRPILTDDGVTVARECLSMEGFEQMVAKSMIEAAANTEKTAFDGTTLTILLTNELYKQGRRWIEQDGLHPQTAADRLQTLIEEVRYKLSTCTMEPTAERVKALANITTKIPLIGELVYQSYIASEGSMNILIEHDRKKTEHSVEVTEGMVLDSGYFSNEMRQLCNEGDTTVFKKAHIALLAEGMLSNIAINEFFMSIPQSAIKDPFVFIITKAFNPESLKMLLDTLVGNQLTFQFVFINDNNPDELFLDIAAKTSGLIQSAAFGTSNYLFQHCGIADVTIELDKTTIIAAGDADKIKIRKDMYEKELKDNQFNTGANRYATITKRLASLSTGVTKIKLACPTITEYMTLRLKLDDAIGAVRCATKHGLVPGGGKALYNLSKRAQFAAIKEPLQQPMKKILENAGIKITNKTLSQLGSHEGYDVKTGQVVNLTQSGIIDSFDSIDTALKNAGSIASNYLRAYILITK